MGDVRWNSSLHALEWLLERVPAGAKTGLDVGCGEGETARRLRRRVPSVVGIDPHGASIEEARTHDDDIEYVTGDIFTTEAAAAPFDVVTSTGMLHHVDHRAGLARVAELVRPGGLLLIVGLATSRSPADFVRDAWDTVALRRHSLRFGVWETPAPKIWPPPVTYAEARAATLDVLPAARFERVPYFRYGITWTRPT